MILIKVSQTHIDDQFLGPGASASVDGEPCEAIGSGVTLHIARINHHLDTCCGCLVWFSHLNLEKACSRPTVSVSTTSFADANHLQVSIKLYRNIERHSRFEKFGRLLKTDFVR